MIETAFEDYCSNCDYLEPEVEKIYADCNIYQLVIFCKNKDRCRAIAEHIENEKKMLKKFLEDECKGYTVQARYDGISETVIFRVFKEDVDVSKVIHRFDVTVNESWNELIIVDTLRRMLREADKKFEEHKANKGKIKKVDKTDDDT